MRRAVLVSLMLLSISVAPAAADPVKNPGARTYTVTCVVDGQSTTFQIVGIGAAGHVLGDNSVTVFMSGTSTIFVNGVQTGQTTVNTPGQGLNTVPCTATHVSDDGTLRIEIVGQLSRNPPR